MVSHGHAYGLYCSFGWKRSCMNQGKDGSGPYPLSFRPFFWHCCQSPEGILSSQTQRGFSAYFIMQPMYTSSTAHILTCIAKKLFSFKIGWAPISSISEHPVSRSLSACVVAVPLSMHTSFSLPLSLPHSCFSPHNKILDCDTKIQEKQDGLPKVTLAILTLSCSYQGLSLLLPAPLHCLISLEIVQHKYSLWVCMCTCVLA